MSEEKIDILINEILELPKSEEITTASSMCSLNVDELFEVIRAFKKVPTYNELIDDNNRKQQEIERLNKELENLEKLNNANYQSFIETNNIIIKLEKWLEDMSNRTTLHISTITGFTMCLDKLQELKEKSVK